MGSLKCNSIRLGASLLTAMALTLLLALPVSAGVPINPLSGVETFRRIDLSIGKQFPISVARRYNSNSSYDSPLGYGWAHNYDKRLYTYPDGSVIIRKECGWKRKFTTAGADFVTPVGETGTLVKNADGTFTYTEKDGSKEYFDLKGRLEKITDPKGNALLLSYEAATRSSLVGLLPTNVDQSTPLVVAYDYRLGMIQEVDATGTPTGAWIAFQYNATTGRQTGLADSLGRTVTYSHDTIGNLKTVTTPAVSAAYGYTDPNDKHLLTSIDEGEGVYTNTYNTQGKVIKQTHGTGVIDIEYPVPFQKSKVTTTIKDSAGTLLNTSTRTVEFDSLGQPSKVTDTFGNETRYTRDPRMNITREERWENIGTITTPNLVLGYAADYIVDTVGNILSRTDAQGSTVEKTTLYTYHPIFNTIATETVKSVVNPAQNRVTTNTYYPDGNLQSTTETGLLGDGTLYSHVTTYEYTNGRITKIDGPRTDVQDVTTFGYDAAGNLISITQPIIGTTTFANHDGLGNPGTITDPNGNSIIYTYDAAGRVLTIKAPGDTAVTQYAYTTSGCTSCGGVANKIDLITLPEGNIIDYTYDANGKLIKIADSQNNSINYSYDSEGNKLKEEIKDASGVLQKTLSYQYDALNRLKQVKNPDATFTEYGYDFRGNRTSMTDPRTYSTIYSYDALNRLTTATQPGSITTAFNYDSNNNLTRVADANNNATVYKYDDAGRVYQTISPDTGTTSYTYDPAGNLKTKTDNSGTTIAYSYDAANRLTKIDFPTDTDIIYAYDACTNGKGRLCQVQDQAGTTSYECTKKGQIAKETKVISGITYVTSYTYNMNGALTGVTYPIGRTITYNYTADRVSGVASTVGTITTTLASNITYKPFGGISGLTYGNGLNRTITYDNQYRPTALTTGSVQNLGYGVDANGNITAISNNLDNTKNKSYTYDALNRLTSGTGPWGTVTWTYDPVGNRLAQTDGAGTSTYSYQTGSNRLASVTGASPAIFTYDANGNTTAENANSFTYNQNQRLIRVAATQVGDYLYSANGQRTLKTVNGTTTVYHYDLNGLLITESAADGIVQAEYVYLNGQPLAKIDSNGIQYILTDHLGTPVAMTNAGGATVWEIETRSFGDAASIVGTGSLNIRFPGQYFDGETGLHQNGRRDYDPGRGRYIQKDPIGFKGGDVNLYAYVGNDPINWIDPTGLTKGGKQKITGNDPLTDGISKSSSKAEIDAAIRAIEEALKDKCMSQARKNYLKAFLKVAKRGFTLGAAAALTALDDFIDPNEANAFDDMGAIKNYGR